MSQCGALDYLGWKDWEISAGALYYNKLHYRYCWEPVNLLTPLYNVRDSAVPWVDATDKLSSIEGARKARNRVRALDVPENPKESRIPGKA